MGISFFFPFNPLMFTSNWTLWDSNLLVAFVTQLVTSAPSSLPSQLICNDRNNRMMMQMIKKQGSCDIHGMKLTKMNQDEKEYGIEAGTAAVRWTCFTVTLTASNYAVWRKGPFWTFSTRLGPWLTVRCSPSSQQLKLFYWKKLN